MKILADASLPNLSVLFGKPFKLTTYDNIEQLNALIGNHDILVCRSTLKVTPDLLANTPIQCVATASSGIDHINRRYLHEHGVVLFDAKGCNARAVADYVIATLAFLQQHGKLLGSKAGIIGHGKAGTQVAARLQLAGLDVICFDPLKAEHNDNYCTLDELSTCDLLCIHANLHEEPPHPSKNLLDEKFFAKLKPGVVVINAARGGVVDEEALLSTSTPITYCTDVYLHEPMIDARIVDFSYLCTPHIAGHSIDAKLAAVIQLREQLHHHYHISMPQLTKPIVRHPLSPQPDWQTCVLSIYNPQIETQQLKTACDKKLAFLSLRHAHKTRHDFIYYDASQLDQKTKSILGNK